MDFTNLDFTNMDFTNMDFDNTGFDNIDFDNIDFDNMDFDNMDFDNTNSNNTNFVNMNIDNMDFGFPDVYNTRNQPQHIPNTITQDQFRELEGWNHPVEGAIDRTYLQSMGHFHPFQATPAPVRYANFQDHVDESERRTAENMALQQHLQQAPDALPELLEKMKLPAVRGRLIKRLDPERIRKELAELESKQDPARTIQQPDFRNSIHNDWVQSNFAPGPPAPVVGGLYKPSQSAYQVNGGEVDDDDDDTDEEDGWTKQNPEELKQRCQIRKRKRAPTAMAVPTFNNVAQNQQMWIPQDQQPWNPQDQQLWNPQNVYSGGPPAPFEYFPRNVG